MAEKKGLFDVQEYLAADGFQLAGLTPEGKYLIRGEDGREGEFDPAEALKAEGLKPEEMDIQFNTPDKPVDQSPVEILDRMKLAAGNTKGQIAFLKNKFEDAAFSEENGLVVKNKGVWQKVDKSGMDAWELSADIAEGAISFVPSMVASGVGAVKGAAAGAAGGAATFGLLAVAPGIGQGLAAAGAAAGGIAGGIAGAGAGGALAESWRTSLGRIVGTYDATPEEQLKDVGIEALLNAGGQVVGVGAKPAISGLARAGKAIGEWAAPGTKEILTTALGTTTGAGPVATKILFEDAEGVAMEVSKSLAKSGRDALNAANVLKGEQVEMARDFLSGARPALRGLFQKGQNKLLSQVDDTFQADIGDEVLAVFRDMEKQGIGRMVPKNAVRGLAERSASTGGKPMDFVFQMNTLDDIEKLIAKGELLPDRLSSETLETLGKFATELNTFQRMPKKTGKAGAEAALSVKRSLSEAAFGLKDKVSPQAASKLTEFSAAIDNKLSTLFTGNSKKGVGQAFAEMNETYSKYVDVVKEADRVASGFQEPEVFVNKLIAIPGSQGTTKGAADLLSNLMGESGRTFMRDFMRKESAKGFVRVFPNFSKLQSSIGAGAAGLAAASGAVSMPVVAAGAAASSPRLVMKQVQYGQKLLGFLQGLGDGARKQWLANPELVDATFREITKGMTDEEQLKEQLFGEAQKAVGGQ